MILVDATAAEELAIRAKMGEEDPDPGVKVLVFHEPVTPLGSPVTLIVKLPVNALFGVTVN